MSKRVHKVVPKLMAFSISARYFYRRNDHYWFCFTYPTPLRQLLGKTELRFSLKTTSKDSARYRASAIALNLKKVLSKTGNATSSLTHPDIKSLAKEWLHDSIRTAEFFYASSPATDEDEWLERLNALAERKGAAEAQPTLNRTRPYERVARSLLESKALTLSDGDFSLLNPELARADVEIMKAHLELLESPLVLQTHLSLIMKTIRSCHKQATLSRRIQNRSCQASY